MLMQSLWRALGALPRRLHVSSRIDLRDQLHTFESAMVDLLHQRDEGERLPQLLARISAYFRADQGNIYLVDSAQRRLELFATNPKRPLAHDLPKLAYGEGIAGCAWQQDRAIVVANYRHWLGRCDADQRWNWLSAIAIPLRVDGEIVGVLVLGAQRARQFYVGDLDSLARFSNLAALVLDNTQAYRETRLERGRSRALTSVGLAVNSDLSMNEVAARVSDQVASGLGGLQVNIRALAESPHAFSARSGSTNWRSDPRGHGGSVSIPILVDEEAWGVLDIARTDRASITQAEIDFASSAAGLLAMALRQKALVKQIRHQVGRDALTGLANRQLFDETLANWLVRARRQKSAIGLLLLDLDGFKQINNTHGHQVGDELLVAVGARLRAQVCAGDFVARMGADEFAVLVPNVVNCKAVEDMADNLRNAVGEPMMIKAASLSCTVSTGVAIYPDDGLDQSRLLQVADAELCRCKSIGAGQANRSVVDAVQAHGTRSASRPGN